jgi:surface polysaccharide O-acyltransferase-like enzyme
MPIMLFGIAMCLAHRHWPQILSRLAPYSFGIYLCHPIFLDLVEISMQNQNITPILQVAIKITLGISLTTALVLAIERSRLLAWTVGLGPLPTPNFSKVRT